MGKKGFDFKPKKYTMNVSSALLWGIVGKTNSMRRKSKHSDFTRDPFSVNNRHSARDLGSVADGARTGLHNADGMHVKVCRKSTRRFVNAAPRVNRKGAENKNAGKHVKSWGVSSCTMNDKNAAVATARGCPMVRRRLAKLHRANCRAQRASNTSE